MTLDEFRRIDAEARRSTPKLFEFGASDKTATPEMLEKVEAELGRALPASFRGFLGAYGGGEFGLVTVFSADSESEWFLPKKAAEFRAYLPPELTPFSDDFAGGVYAFKADTAGVLEDRVWCWSTDEGAKPTHFADALEYIARYAFRPA